MTIIRIRVDGFPRPAGSKTAYPFERKHVPPGCRRLGVRVADANPLAKKWKAVVSQAAKLAYDGEPLDVPVFVRFTFELPRPGNHYRTGKHADKLREKAPAYPAVKPDLLKLARAVEDALTGIVWSDDALICWEELRKVYGDAPGVTIDVCTL